MGAREKIECLNVLMWHQGRRDFVRSSFRMCSWKKDYFDCLPISNRKNDDLQSTLINKIQTLRKTRLYSGLQSEQDWFEVSGFSLVTFLTDIYRTVSVWQENVFGYLVKLRDGWKTKISYRSQWGGSEQPLQVCTETGTVCSTVKAQRCMILHGIGTVCSTVTAQSYMFVNGLELSAVP